MVPVAVVNGRGQGQSFGAGKVKGGAGSLDADQVLWVADAGV